MIRYKCDECGRVTTEDALLSAEHPFDAEDVVYGCPQCKSINCFSRVCDEPGCEDIATGGRPTPEGYRQTCWDHRPRDYSKENRSKNG